VPSRASRSGSRSRYADDPLTVSEDSVEQTGADSLARVHRHNCAPAILVTQKVMAAFNAKEAKTYIRGRQ
jgi:hypothetical protein